jgi:hypothetical protein
MMEAILSSETAVLIRATRSNIPEDGILHRRLVRIVEIDINVTGKWAYYNSSGSRIAQTEGRSVRPNEYRPIEF